MAVDDADVTARGAWALREQAESGWYAIVDEVIARIRATPRAGWPITVDDPQPGDAAGVLHVGSFVLAIRILRALSGDLDITVLDVDISVENGALRSVSLELAGRYGSDLRQSAARVISRCAVVIAEVVGERPGARVHVTFADVDR